VTWADLAILGILTVSSVVSLLRGFISEVMSLVVWVAAFFIASTGAGIAAEQLLYGIDLPQARIGVAFTGLFLLSLTIGGMITWLIRYMVRRTGLDTTDRLLGLVFGFTRGLLLVTALVLLAGLTALPKTAWWQASKTLPPFEHTALLLKPHLPAQIRDLLDYASQWPAPVEPPTENR
jgi:membrane protein required for colicin V production